MKTGTGVQPKEAIEFLKRKKIVETEHWDDLKLGEHSHAFTVAHSANAAILEDLHKILYTAMENGESFQKTKREIKTLMAKKGWYGRRADDPDAVNPDAGSPPERKKAKRYINWRVGIIYQQNMLTAYSAGQTRKLWSVQHIYPFWQYKQRQRKNKREAHSAWHNMVLPANDPAWGAITPPNDWRCACYRIPLTKEQAEKAWAGGAAKALPSEGVELSPTWAYDPAREALAPNWQAYTNLAKAGVRGELKKNYRAGIAATQMSRGEWEAYSRATIERVDDDKKVQVLISTLAQPVIDALDFDPKLMGTSHSVHHGGRGRGKGKKGKGGKGKSGFNPKRDLTFKEIGAMPQRLANPDAIYKSEIDGHLLFVYRLNGEKEARVVFRQNGGRPLQLISYTKVPSGSTEEQQENKKIYEKK